MALRRLHLLAYISLCLIWGSTWLAIRVTVRYVPPLLAAGLRFSLAAVCLFAWVILRRLPRPAGTRQWNALLVLGFTVIAIPYGLLFWAEQYVTSSLSAILFSALPLTVTLLTPLMLHRKVPRGAVLAMVVAFGALLVLLYTGFELGSRSFWAAIAVLGAMCFGAWSTVYAKLRLKALNPIVSTAWQLMLGSLGLFWGTWALESHRHAVWTRSAVLALLFLATLGSAAAFAIYYWLLQRMEAYQLSSLNLVLPIVAVVEGSFLGREPIPLLMIVVMFVVMASVGAVLRTEAEDQPQSLTADCTDER